MHKTSEIERIQLTWHKSVFHLHVQVTPAMAATRATLPTIISQIAPPLSLSSSDVLNPQTRLLFPAPRSAFHRAVKHSAMAEPQCSSSSSDMAGIQGGRIQRQVLSNEGRTKLNPSSDRSFYSSPRLVTHVDDQFLATLTDLYRDRVPENADVLDLMSSWVSHLPGKIVSSNLYCLELCWLGYGEFIAVLSICLMLPSLLRKHWV